MMRKQEINTSDIFELNDARCDVNYFINKNNGNSFVPFFDIFQEPEKIELSFDDIEDEFYYCEIGTLSSSGELFPVFLNKNQRYSEDDDNAKLYSKIFSGNEKDKLKDIMAVNENDILIAKTRPILNKIALISKNEYIDYSCLYFTTAFYRFRAKDGISPVVAYYLAKTVLNKEFISISRIGKSGYPAIDYKDFKNIKIPLSKEQLMNKEMTDKIEKSYMKILQARQKAKKIEDEETVKIGKLFE